MNALNKFLFVSETLFASGMTKKIGRIIESDSETDDIPSTENISVEVSNGAEGIQEPVFYKEVNRAYSEDEEEFDRDPADVAVIPDELQVRCEFEIDIS